ncbi:MAG: hypothetical protein QM681_09860 [Novosphingobium sp.]
MELVEGAITTCAANCQRQDPSPYRPGKPSAPRCHCYEPYVVVMAERHPLAGTAEIAAGTSPPDDDRPPLLRGLQRTSRFFTDAGVAPLCAAQRE